MMNTSARAQTQFYVAVLGMAGLVLITMVSIAGTIWAEAPSELTYMLVGGLLSITSTAGAWLFRLNGTGKGSSDDKA